VRSSVSIKKGAEPDEDRLRWKLTSGAPIALLDFGSPETVTDLTMCVLDGDGLELSATAAAGGACNGKPCWRATDRVIKYADRRLERGTIAAMTLKAGDARRAKITVKAGGGGLAAGALPLAGDVVVRLKRSGGPACWQAEYATPQRNDGARYDAELP
jgi:hypothetical protein